MAPCPPPEEEEEDHVVDKVGEEVEEDHVVGEAKAVQEWVFDPLSTPPVVDADHMLDAREWATFSGATLASMPATLSLARRWAPDGEPIEIEGGGYFWGGVELPLSPWMQCHMEKCREFSANEQDLILLACYHTLTGIRGA